MKAKEEVVFHSKAISAFSKTSQTAETNIKTKRCNLCEQELPIGMFTSTRAKYCGPCKQIRSLKQAQEMQQRAMGRLKNKKDKTVGIVRVSDLKKQVQKAFNKWVRKRDDDLPCISCGGDCGKWDAGHFIAQGSSGALRFHPDNVHKQGVGCNRFKHGNLLEYRIGLVKKVGLERVEYLEEHRHDTKKWTREELEKLLEEYKC